MKIHAIAHQHDPLLKRRTRTPAVRSLGLVLAIWPLIYTLYAQPDSPSGARPWKALDGGKDTHGRGPPCRKATR